MSLKKLSEADKNEIIKLYRESEETTSTLAERFEVSSSTISRFLKGSFSLEEYEELIQKKRLARTPYRRQSVNSETESLIWEQPESSETKAELIRETSEPESSETKAELIREISEPESSVTKAELIREISEPESSVTKAELITSASLEEIPPNHQPSPITNSDVQKVVSSPEPMKVNQHKPTLINQYPVQQLDLFASESDDDDDAEQVEVLTLQQLLGEDIGDLDEDYDEDYDDNEEISSDEEQFASLPHPVNGCLEILPLSQASLPKVCYVVIDRRSELITRPLKDFRELGKIPLTEIQEQTLPIFDNHRIARRFSNRRERVIKVPDSSIFAKTCSYLQAKGITRIFIDGQVYSLN